MGSQGGSPTMGVTVGASPALLSLRELLVPGGITLGLSHGWEMGFVPAASRRGPVVRRGGGSVPGVAIRE